VIECASVKALTTPKDRPCHVAGEDFAIEAILAARDPDRVRDGEPFRRQRSEDDRREQGGGAAQRSAHDSRHRVNTSNLRPNISDRPSRARRAVPRHTAKMAWVALTTLDIAS
jgi:hypothetical protein